MKRTIAHTVTAAISLVYLVLRLANTTSIVLVFWYAPSIISLGTVTVLLMRNLRNKPVQADETMAAFCAAVISTNFNVVISLFGNMFPLYRTAPLAWLQTAGMLLNLLSLPLYISIVLSLGRGFTILPEAHTLQVNGMYRISRHPIYLTYAFWCLTQNMIYQTLAVLVFSFVQIALFCYRARCEEKVLLATFPGYAVYAERVTWLGPKRAFRNKNLFKI